MIKTDKERESGIIKLTGVINRHQKESEKSSLPVIPEIERQSQSQSKTVAKTEMPALVDGASATTTTTNSSPANIS